MEIPVGQVVGAEHSLGLELLGARDASALTTLEGFKFAVDRRKQQLDYLAMSLQQGLEVVTDLELVNQTITASARPELVMTEPVAQQVIRFPFEPFELNNFYSKFRGFGVSVYGIHTDLMGEAIEQRIGRRLPTEEERAVYFVLGGRGGYKETLAYAVENNLDEGIAHDIVSHTLVDKEAFMRMWILLPELTIKLSNNCLNTDFTDSQYIDEELFVAYCLMSRLVDKGDSNVLGRDGALDTRFLQH